MPRRGGEKAGTLGFHGRQLVGFQTALLAWYGAHRRDLPWRRSRVPYRIWVSETMLQQTQVATVVPYYTRFIERFPTLESLAEADIDDVLPYWSGLGYYRRVRNLHAAARWLVENRGGQVPCHRDELLALPGVGRYTAGAVLSIAYGQPEPILDGNITRILCRLFEVTSNTKESRTSRILWELAAALVPDGQAADFNQALMELGATVCLPQKPVCLHCPVRRFCLARKHGTQESLPLRTGKDRSEKRILVSVLIERQGRLLIMRRDHPTLMTGMWEVPMVELPAGERFDTETVMDLFRRACGLRLSSLAEIGRASHSITYRRITLHVCRAVLRNRASTPGVSRRTVRWIAPQEISGYGVSSLSLKSLRLLSST